jgi:hypothetical protein
MKEAASCIDEYTAGVMYLGIKPFPSQCSSPFTLDLMIIAISLFFEGKTIAP